jgi:hypothetical protein
MRTFKALLVAALAAGGLALTADVSAQEKGGAFRGGGSGGHWNGGGHWRGGGHWNGGHWRGGHGHGGFHHHFFGPRFSFAFGVPLFWGPYYWGYPYYGYDWDGPRVVYREVIRDPEVIIEREAPATTEIPRGEGAPTAGPLYMNYCASAKAYFPKVTTCPEGWKFISPTR